MEKEIQNNHYKRKEKNHIEVSDNKVKTVWNMIQREAGLGKISQSAVETHEFNSSAKL